MPDFMQAMSDELTQLQTFGSRLRELRKKSVTSASAHSDYEELLALYERIALPRGQFGRVPITLDSEDEAELCDAIDAQIDRIALLDATAFAWRSGVTKIIEQVEHLAQLGSGRLLTILESGTSQSPAQRRAAAQCKHAAAAHRAAA